MAGINVGSALERERFSDEEVVERVLAGETALFEILMRRYNQRVYRVARGILGNDAEAEDVMQDAYVRAYEHLRQFERRARFSTWLTKIAVYEALSRLRRLGRLQAIDSITEAGGDEMPILSSTRPRAPGPRPGTGRGSGVGGGSAARRLPFCLRLSRD